jgi:hypothetical protein
MALDYVLAAVCALIIFGTLFHGAALARLPVTGWHARDWLPPVLAVCLSIPVAIRRREPVLAFAVILAVCAWVLVLRGEITRGPVLPLALVLYLVAATRGRRAALTALAAALALLTVQGVIPSLTGAAPRTRSAPPEPHHLPDDRLLGRPAAAMRPGSSSRPWTRRHRRTAAHRQELHDVVAAQHDRGGRAGRFRRVRVRPAAGREPGQRSPRSRP